VAKAEHPIDPAQLLAAAEVLAPDEPREGPSAFTERRRAVSTAYYAAFHAISGRVATTVFPNAEEIFRQRISRWIAHTDIRTVARWVMGQGPGEGKGVPSHIQDLLEDIEGPIDADTVAIAEGFLKLHEQRAQQFFGLIAMQAQVRGR
jgi:hypothetical protein